MGPGDSTPSTMLEPPSFSNSKEKLQWRKSVRYWTQNAQAFSIAGDSRLKGSYAALVLLLFRSLPIGKQQIVEKSVNSGEIILDPTDLGAPREQSEVVEKIISLVDKDSETGAIRRMATLNK